MKQGLLKGIAWTKPKKFINRFIMVTLFTIILTGVAYFIDIVGSFIFKLIGA